MFENFDKSVCPIDKKRCDAEIHRFLRQHEHSDGIDWGQCRYGPFGEIDDGGSSYIPPNCESNRPRTKHKIITMEGETENSRHRQYGYHDIANKHTETINPKKDALLSKKCKYSEDYCYASNPMQKRDNIDLEKDRKKKSAKKTAKRKPIKKVIKKCKCK